LIDHQIAKIVLAHRDAVAMAAGAIQSYIASSLVLATGYGAGVLFFIASFLCPILVALIARRAILTGVLSNLALVVIIEVRIYLNARQSGVLELWRGDLRWLLPWELGISLVAAVLVSGLIHFQRKVD
jgi:hypothetical protein